MHRKSQCIVYQVTNYKRVDSHAFGRQASCKMWWTKRVLEREVTLSCRFAKKQSPSKYSIVVCSDNAPLMMSPVWLPARLDAHLVASLFTYRPAWTGMITGSDTISVRNEWPHSDLHIPIQAMYRRRVLRRNRFTALVLLV